MKRPHLFVAAVLAGIPLASPLHASDWTTHPAPYAKRLAERIVKSSPDIMDAIFHVTPPGSTENYAIAAHTPTEQGSKSGEDDLSVMITGKPLVEVQKDGKRIGVIVQLQDHSHHSIGALGLMYVYHVGEDQDSFLKRSNAVRDKLAKKIESKEILFK